MKATTDKCQVIMSTDKKLEILIEDSSITSSSCVKSLFEVRIDSKLNLDDEVKTICSKTRNKLGTLACVNCCKICLRSSSKLFFNAHLNFCPLIYYSCSNNNVRRQIHKRWSESINSLEQFFKLQLHNLMHMPPVNLFHDNVSMWEHNINAGLKFLHKQIKSKGTLLFTITVKEVNYKDNIF